MTVGATISWLGPALRGTVPSCTVRVGFNIRNPDTARGFGLQMGGLSSNKLNEL